MKILLLSALLASGSLAFAAPDAGAASETNRPFAMGYMLDISRDKVPTLPTLFRMVDILARLGYNQFQLYTEHTFAYRGHEKVWAKASPMTPEEIRSLDEYCWSHGVELVPNQNSFGHMERWLVHPEYRALAEAPDCAVNPWGGRAPYPKALCPTDPAATNFLADLYGQLLPCFRHTRNFNVGCDEVFDLVPGVRSAAALRERGEADVFLEHLENVRHLAAVQGRRIMYWADHLLDLPDAHGRLPKDAVAIVYMYEAEGPFRRLVSRVAGEGVPFYVGPGTSSWCSMFGRYWNMKGNVSQAMQAAREFGAEGFLLCDWGDEGHCQPFIVSLPALVYASECAKGHVPTDADVVRRIDEITGARCGEALLEYGDLYRISKSSNVSQLFMLMFQGKSFSRPWSWSDAKLADVFAQGHEAQRKLDLAGAPDWVKDDFALLALLLRATELSWNRQYEQIAREIPAPYRALWLRQNRPGGLEDSVKKLFVH